MVEKRLNNNNKVFKYELTKLIVRNSAAGRTRALVRVYSLKSNLVPGHLKLSGGEK